MLSFNMFSILSFNMLILSIIICLSTISWFLIWMSLEMNTLMFLPLMLNNKAPSSLSMMNYFIVQSLGSILFLITILFNKFCIFESFNEIIILSMLMKMGFCPFHNWLIQCSEGLDWINLLILSSLQKIIPLYILSMCLLSSLLLLFCWGLSVITSSMLMFNLTSVRKFVIVSSINHLCWILLIMTLNLNLWMIYFIIYLLSLYFFISLAEYHQIQNLLNFINVKSKISMFMLMTSVGGFMGVPPFLGFLPKLIVLQITSKDFLFLLGLLLSSFFNSYIYIRLLLNSMNSIWLFSPLNSKFNIQTLINLNIMIFPLMVIYF